MDKLDELSFSFRCLIDRPVAQVFAAVTDRTAISTYFTDDASAGLEAGRTVIWRFGEIEVDVAVEEVILNQRIVCDWPASNDVGYRTRFVFEFEARNGGTRISVSESGWWPDRGGIDSAFDQCSGWTHFFASLKARLEYDVDLKRFYDDGG
ncbi:MAG: SRPBCC domain-containing protein [Gemmatimonadota bacterium]|nr:SRPBCC domain-containing protein [Gemmatimonadota bacterium]